MRSPAAALTEASPAAPGRAIAIFKKQQQQQKTSSCAAEPTSDEGITGGRGDSAVVLPVFGHVDVAAVAPLLPPAEEDERNRPLQPAGRELTG